VDRDAARHHFIDKRRWFGYAANSRSVQDAFGRGYSRKRSGSGARARSDTLRSRAASGIMLAGITTGPGGAFPGLGQAGAGNARERCAIFVPRWTVSRIVHSRHVPGSLA
jgi:hypothetical protein